MGNTRSRSVVALARLLIACVLLVLSSCDRGRGSGSGGTAAVPPILSPFQGDWRFSLPKTIAHWQANGVPQDELAQAQALPGTIPLHPDMKIQSDITLLAGVVEGSYHFFALHPHNQWVCGKAWHHEDRHDPGDMEKYFVRLELSDADLHLSVRIPEDSADPADPDITNMPVTAGSAANCAADAATTPPWSPWRTYVFERRGQ